VPHVAAPKSPRPRRLTTRTSLSPLCFLHRITETLFPCSHHLSAPLTSHRARPYVRHRKTGRQDKMHARSRRDTQTHLGLHASGGRAQPWRLRCLALCGPSIHPRLLKTRVGSGQMPSVRVSLPTKMMRLTVSVLTVEQKCCKTNAHHISHSDKNLSQTVAHLRQCRALEPPTDSLENRFAAAAACSAIRSKPEEERQHQDGFGFKNGTF
jgi:hypothetical protein